MAQAAEAAGGVTIRTEAESIRDWGSVCEHVSKRARSFDSETTAFLKLFESLAETYRQYRDMCETMRGTITTQKEYVEVPDYHETAIHKGCGLIQKCLDAMFVAYNELYEHLVAVCERVAKKQSECATFVEQIVPFVDSTKALYLSKESELQTTMHVYMQAAEHNDRGFFIVAKEYQKKLLEFQQILKSSTDSMQDAILKVQTLEKEKKEFESGIERGFIEAVLSQQTQTQSVFQASLQELERLCGENAWQVLTDKLQLYKEDGSTIFDDPVPNKAGALIKSWMERDMEMTCPVARNSACFTGNCMIVTRWGFVQIYKDTNDIQPSSEFYIYDYRIVPAAQQTAADADALTTNLAVRQHQTFAPLKGLVANYAITFQDQETKLNFERLVEEFKQTHAPQT